MEREGAEAEAETTIAEQPNSRTAEQPNKLPYSGLLALHAEHETSK